MVCNWGAKTAANTNAPTAELPLLTVGLQELFAKSRIILSHPPDAHLGPSEKSECFCNLCLHILLNNTVLHRNRISSQIYEQSLGLLR